MVPDRLPVALQSGPEAVVRAQGRFHVGVVVHLHLPDAEPVQDGLVELVAADVLPVGPGPERVGRGHGHEVGVLRGDRVLGAVGQGHLPVGERGVED